MTTGGTPLWVWATFGAAVALLLAADLIANRGERRETRGHALFWSAVFVGAGLTFGIFVWLALGRSAAEQYVAAWLLELSLSLDNLFVFLLVFQSLGEEFVACEEGRRVITPLLVALVAIELTDIVFAIDSIPTALSVSRNVFVIYSANILAVLGMRALYLLLADPMGQLRYLHYALAAILLFTAFKLSTESWISIPPLVSVGIIVVAIVAAVVPSLRAKGNHSGRRARPAASEEAARGSTSGD